MAYLIGNLIGRLIVSALIVWLVMFLIKRFDFKSSIKSLKQPLPILSILIIFCLGILGGTA